jgi:proteasome assembly chaperone (PAC2) family protein
LNWITSGSGGLIKSGRLPRSRCFVWNDPEHQRDIVVFIGEAQPPLGKYAFCSKLIAFAQELGVERVFTFAAMATQMHPEHSSRVFAAGTNAEILEELTKFDLEPLEEGHIGGLNGLLLGAAADAELHGACLLGEMPHIFAQLPFPKASLAVLKIFAAMTGIEVDFAELSEQSEAMNEKLGELLAKVEMAMEQHRGVEEEPSLPEPEEESRLSPEDEQEIERMFAEAKQDRSKAYELKQKLDQLDLFRDYEDRFLDLFKNE